MPDNSFQSTSTPPSGTITFLFSDIQGSTTLWERHPAAMKVALARHDAILRETISAHGGYVFKVIGDAFQSAFANAADALAAAAQRALAAETWGETGAIRVRMGLHTGSAEWQESDYAVSHTLNRVARVMSAGHGGQILLSGETAELTRDQLPIGASLRDLGNHRLKGLIQPEHIFQLVAPGLPADFPPLIISDTYAAHYESVIRAISEGRVVPCLGPEVNLCGRASTIKWKYGQLNYLPSGHELSEHLAKSFDYPANESSDNLLRVSQYVSIMSGSGPLYEKLHTLLDADYAPTPLHQFFATLPAIWRAKSYPPYPLIVTTNYDDALERAFRAAQEPFDLVTFIATGDERGKFMHWSPDGKVRLIDKPNKYRGLSLDERTVILKLHGVVDRANAERDSFVITEDDYIDSVHHRFESFRVM